MWIFTDHQCRYTNGINRYDREVHPRRCVQMWHDMFPNQRCCHCWVPGMLAVHHGSLVTQLSYKGYSNNGVVQGPWLRMVSSYCWSTRGEAMRLSGTTVTHKVTLWTSSRVDPWKVETMLNDGHVPSFGDQHCQALCVEAYTKQFGHHHW